MALCADVPLSNHSFQEKVVSYPKNLLIYTNIVFLVNLDAWYADK